MKITVIGAGNTGCIMAFDLAQKGAEVRLYTRSKEKAAYLTNRGLEADGRLQGKASLALVTDDMQEAVRGAETIFIMTTANGRRPMAEALKPLLEQNQTIIVFNGNWGALEFRQVIGKTSKIVIGETGTQLYIGNLLESGRVFVKQVKEEATLATTDPARRAETIQKLHNYFPQFREAGSVMETSLSSANAAVHAPVCLFNLGRIELGHDFLFYKEGASRSVVAYIEGADRERMAIMAALGVPPRSTLEIINSFWPNKKDNLYDAIRENPSYQTVKGPKDLTHRFLAEDLPYGVVPQVRLGRALGVATPHMDAMLAAFSFFLGKDLLAEGFCPDLAELLELKASL